jgi:DNA-binding transcriptional regulator YhcF (GntR family)
MSIWINWRVAIVKNRALSFGAKGMALYLNTFMNDRQDCAWPSIATICGEMGITDKTAKKHICELEEHGFLARQKRFGNTILYYAMIPDQTVKEAQYRNPSETGEIPTQFRKLSDTVSEDFRTNKQKNKQENKTDDRFSEFWTSYPRKEGKKKAETSFRRLTEKQKDEAIRDIKGGRYSKTETRFVPHAATYLNQERWNDEVSESTALRFYGNEL